jgi:uncharacterized protein YciI
MLFAVICKDKADALPSRLANRPDHLAYLESLGDRLRCAGALLASEGGDPLGSLVIVEAETLAEAQAIADGDPFSKAGVFESVEVKPWRLAPVGAVQKL